jgi:phosphoglycerate dehydrogenase-like enzyme
MSIQSTRVLITCDLEELAPAAAAVPGVEVAAALDRTAILDQIGEAEVLCLAGFDAEMFRAAKKLKWVQAMLGGVEKVLFPELVQSEIPLTCIKECFGVPGAEHAMAAMLAVSSRLNEYAWLRSKRKLEWRLPRELHGKTIGIIGFGNIGRALGERARAFGMRVLAAARRPTGDVGPAHEVLAQDQLPRLLVESDFVVVAVPLTQSTRGLIGPAQLKAMKPSAWLIDISGRPAIVEQDAVIAALREKQIAGADLQFGTAPAADSPLWTMENLIISQYSANSEEEGRRSVELFVENLRRYRQNQPLIGLVDKRAGY